MGQQKQEFVAVSAESKSIEVISWKKAKEAGLKRYFTGKACKRGHVEERIVSTRCCVGCARERSRDEAASRAEYFKNYRNTDERKKRSRELSQSASYKERKKERARELYSENKEKYRKKAMNKYWKGRKAILSNKSKRCKERRSSDPDYISICACRNMVSRVLNLSENTKTGRTESLIGYTSEDLRDHLESKFKDGMSWSNYGDWEIDHIKPVSVFFSENEKDPKIINALDNLQPLWKSENRSKGAKYNAKDS